ncbi:MAG: DUF2254 domain-containing protein [Thermoanaerobaculia bacterium]
MNWKTRVRAWIEKLRASLWLIPSLMTAAAVASSFLAVAADRHVAEKFEHVLGPLFAGGPEGARSILSTLAGSMITVTGVTFSITVVALSLASQQFGPRVLRNFMVDRGNQAVLGTFIATFIYSLLVLRTVRGYNDHDFVPYLAVTIGVGLALVSLGVLIFFIHHVSASIQADRVVAAIAAEMIDSIERLFPEGIGHAPEDASEIESHLPDGEPGRVKCRNSGYIQVLDEDSVLHLAERCECLIQLIHSPGDFVFEGVTLARVWPADRMNEGFEEHVNRAIVLGRSRTPAQDVEFAFAQLVELAVRSLSPAINDPFTASSCINRIGAGIARLATLEFPSPYRYGADGKPRVIATAPSFAEISSVAFDQIRHEGGHKPSIAISLLQAIASILPFATEPERRDVLFHHARMIRQHAVHSIPEAEDRSVVDRVFNQVLDAYHHREVETRMKQEILR